MELLQVCLLELGVADRFRHDLRRVTLPWYPVDKAGADLQPVPKALEMLEGFLRLEHALLQRHVLTVVPAETFLARDEFHGLARLKLEDAIDRKRTRLNSSH